MERKVIASSHRQDGLAYSVFPRPVSGKERSLLRRCWLRLPVSHWFQFNPLSLMNANKGVFGVNLGHMWGEIDRQRQWADQLLNLWTQGAIKPKVARTFSRSPKLRKRTISSKITQEYRQSPF